MFLFIKNLTVFLLISCGIYVICFFLYMHVIGLSFKNLPAPKLSNNFSFNEKDAFLRTKTADIISIGSSASLVDLYSSSITNSFNSKSYINTSSIGASIRDAYELLKIYVEIHKPKTVVIASSIYDFTCDDKTVDYKDVKSYLATSENNMRLLKYFDVLYTLRNMLDKKKFLKSDFTTSYESLLYDDYGAIMVKKDSIKIKALKQNVELESEKEFLDFRLGNLTHDTLTNSTNKEFYHHNMSYLDSISILCKLNKINLYFFQSPIRQSLYYSLSPSVINQLTNHTIEEQKILSKNGQHYVNSFNRAWDDSLFVDSHHMNSIGAKIFTEYCLEESK